jgi:uncharacterized membrane protein
MKKPNSIFEWIFLLLALVGFLDSLYLIWIKIANSKAYCLQGVGDCWTVNTSKYSEVMGIPVAVFGVGGYFLVLMVFLLENRVRFFGENNALIQFGLTLVGFLYSIYLTYLELFVINAICPFCVLSAVSVTILFILSITRLAKSQAESQTEAGGEHA